MRQHKEDLLDAMVEAQKAFEKSLSDKEIDPSFFDIKMEGYYLSNNFRPIETVVFNPECLTVDTKVKKDD